MAMIFQLAGLKEFLRRQIGDFGRAAVPLSLLPLWAHADVLRVAVPEPSGRLPRRFRHAGRRMHPLWPGHTICSLDTSHREDIGRWFASIRVWSRCSRASSLLFFPPLLSAWHRRLSRPACPRPLWAFFEFSFRACWPLCFRSFSFMVWFCRLQVVSAKIAVYGNRKGAVIQKLVGWKSN